MLDHGAWILDIIGIGAWKVDAGFGDHDLVRRLMEELVHMQAQDVVTTYFEEAVLSKQLYVQHAIQKSPVLGKFDTLYAKSLQML